LNQSAFLWGRRAAVNLDAVLNLTVSDQVAWQPLTDPDEIIEWRYDRLVNYQNRRWAEKYLAVVEKVREQEPADSGLELTISVAKNLFHLMSYKDEYEVARLFTDGGFRRELEARFEGDYSIHFHLAPPILAKRDPLTGLPEKRRLPGWTLGLFRALAAMKGLRGTLFDPFGYSVERRMERSLIEEYAGVIEAALPHLDSENYARAVELANLPMAIRGFGHVKEASVDRYRQELELARRRFHEPQLAVVVNG
jgi:indolepyruvate ferredoxin oxidoreductase